MNLYKVDQDINPQCSGKIRIVDTLTPNHLFTIMENTTFVNQGLALLTESLDPPKIISRYLPVNFDTISKATLLFENLRSLVSAWDTIVQCQAHWLVWWYHGWLKGIIPRLFYQKHFFPEYFFMVKS